MREAREIRWRPCINVTGDSHTGGIAETIPPYSLVELWHASVSSVSDGTEDILLVRKPTRHSATSQNPAVLAVTGPQPIAVHQSGQCTQDWPAMVAYTPPTTKKLQRAWTVGAFCGPVDDSFEPALAGAAFTILGHVATRPLQQDTAEWHAAYAWDPVLRKSGQHCIWISPPGRRNFGGASTLTSSGTAEPGDMLILGNDNSAAFFAGSSVNIEFLPGDTGDQYSDNRDGWRRAFFCREKGTYLFGVSATLQSDASVPAGTVLGLRLMRVGVDEEGSTTYGLTGWTAHEAHRTVLVATDEYGTKTQSAENVAFSGFVSTDGEEYFSVGNMATYSPMYYSSFTAWMMHFSPFQPSPVLDLPTGYPSWVNGRSTTQRDFIPRA